MNAPWAVKAYPGVIMSAYQLWLSAYRNIYIVYWATNHSGRRWFAWLLFIKS